MPRQGMLTWRYGEEIRADPEAMKESGWASANLRKRGFSPATLIDVGVAYGTPHLYRAFPDAYRVLLEPLAECEEALTRLTQANGEYHLVAIGREDGELEIRVDREVLWMSSALELTSRPQSYELRTVPLRALDSLLIERDWTPPYGLKVDVEGFEDQVVLGGKRLLEQTQFVIAEISVVRRYASGGIFADFIRLMAEHGFALCDILDAQKLDPAEPIYFMDALFRREAS